MRCRFQTATDVMLRNLANARKVRPFAGMHHQDPLAFQVALLRRYKEEFVNPFFQLAKDRKVASNLRRPILFTQISGLLSKIISEGSEPKISRWHWTSFYMDTLCEFGHGASFAHLSSACIGGRIFVMLRKMRCKRPLIGWHEVYT